MKLRNKKTGEIRDFIIKKDKIQTASAIDCCEYHSLAELNAEWEDAPEEPSRHWFISGTRAYEENCYSDEAIADLESVGNHFKTKEEAERAIEKLKAFKRLKDKGFRTYDICKSPTGFVIHFEVDWEHRGVMEDLDLLFGGEE